MPFQMCQYLVFKYVNISSVKKTNSRYYQKGPVQGTMESNLSCSQSYTHLTNYCLLLWICLSLNL